MGTGTAEKTSQDAGQMQEKPKDLAAPGAGLDSGKVGGAETKLPEKTYRQSEVDAQLAKVGQRMQVKLEAVVAERDSYKSQVETLQKQISESKQSIASLTEDIDAMSKDDPDKIALVKRRRELESELSNLKLEKAELATSRNEVMQWKRDQLVYSVADEFVTATGESVDFDFFKNAADKFKLSGREELETLAETMGLKPKGEVEKPEEPKIPPPKGYSGVTAGGAIDLNSLTPKEKIRMGYSKSK